MNKNEFIENIQEAAAARRESFISIATSLIANITQDLDIAFTTMPESCGGINFNLERAKDVYSLIYHYNDLNYLNERTIEYIKNK